METDVQDRRQKYTEKVCVVLTRSSKKCEKTEETGEKQQMNRLIKLIYCL